MTCIKTRLMYPESRQSCILYRCIVSDSEPVCKRHKRTLTERVIGNLQTSSFKRHQSRNFPVSFVSSLTPSNPPVRCYTVKMRQANGK
ncbi:unnamed protein product, partial [Linum tenue]